MGTHHHPWPQRACRIVLQGHLSAASHISHGKSGVNAAKLAARFILAVGQFERDWGHRKPPHPLLPPGINTINAGVM
jgi:acetylornithine deacetylase/succinyl-diaminopimelate desuccinylase-like protein